jgi:hypothetical protein
LINFLYLVINYKIMATGKILIQLDDVTFAEFESIKKVTGITKTHLYNEAIKKGLNILKEKYLT